MSFRQVIYGSPGKQTIVRSSTISNSFFGSINGDTIIVSNGVITGGHGQKLPAAAKIEIIALDKDGKKLDSFQLPANTDINLNITAKSIAKAKVGAGQLTIVQCDDINKVEATSGTIRIENCNSINTARVSSGNLTVTNCGKLGKAKATSGNVRVNDTVRRGRDSSPVRAKKGKVVKTVINKILHE